MAKILIAEDDKSTLDVFCTAIESLGHCVIKAANGRMAWEVLCANPEIAFLVCDVVMPEMDGRELVKLIRGTPRFAALPILIVSGAIRAKEIATLLEQGVAHFIAKPVNVPELVEVVKKHVA